MHRRGLLMRTHKAVRTVAAVTALTLVGVVAIVARPLPATAAPITDFDPGFIISDSVFYDSGSMDAAGIQAFLELRNPSCRPGSDGTPCLKDYRETTWTRPATTRCAGDYVGAPNERASDIIAKVARACGINPRVLIVTLQKEQSLVTATGSTLYASRYRSAMGFGCPDSAACDSQYYGFFNQVYSAASQFRNYALNPTRYSHRAGATNNVRFHPNVACGSSAVFIRNQATASLYNYTPYQPNAAALAAGTGTGDACSSYGNRNFWYYFNTWFGKPTGSSPVGFLDSAEPGDLVIAATGWAFDPDTTVPIYVRMTVDGRIVEDRIADAPRPDVDAIFHTGGNHGFDRSIPVEAGTRTICAYGLDTEGSAPAANLGCRTVFVPARPTGFLDSVTTTPTSITASGWALDPDTTDPVQVRVTVDGTAQTFTANAPRPDIGRVFGKGDNHGYSATVPAAPGQHTVCVEALKAAPSRDTQLGCRTVTVLNNAPIGYLDQVTTTATSITASGWTLDPDTTDPVQVRVTVDGTAQTFTANTSRPDVGRAFGKGDNHGYSATTTVTEGRHTVCVEALDTTTGAATTIGCRTVTVANQAPFGFLDSVTTTPTSITASGWALDPDTTDPITVHLYVDGVSQAFTANTPRSDIGRIFGKGDNHGYTITVPAAPGQHTVCLYAINTPSSTTNPQLGCRTVAVG